MTDFSDEVPDECTSATNSIKSVEIANQNKLVSDKGQVKPLDALTFRCSYEETSQNVNLPKINKYTVRFNSYKTPLKKNMKITGYTTRQKDSDGLSFHKADGSKLMDLVDTLKSINCPQNVNPACSKSNEIREFMPNAELEIHSVVSWSSDSE